METAKIFIVEDESIIAMELEERLTQLGYTVTGSAADSETALQKVKAQLPDIVMMDIHLKGSKDGIETAGEIHSQFSIPVIYLTAYADDATMQRAKVTEPFGYLLKPFREQELRAAIEMALYKHGMEKRLQATEARNKALLNANPDLMFLHDRAGTYLDFHASNPALLFVPSEEFLGKNIRDVFRAELAELFINAIQNALDNDTEQTIEYQLMLNHEQHFFEARVVSCTKQMALALVRDVTERKRTESRLHQANQILETVFEHSHMMVAYMDAKFNFIRVNRAYAKVNKKTPGFFVGKNHFKLYPNAGDEAMFRYVVESGQWHAVYARSYENKKNKKRGISYWDWVVAPVKDSENKVTGVILTQQDVTKRVKAEEERTRLAAILEATPDFVATADVNGNILYYNRAAREMLGIGENEDISGIHITDTHPKWAGEIVRNQLLPALMTEGSWSGETAFLSHDGREIPVSQVALAHKNLEGNIEFLSTIARDITERKKAEDNLRARTIELEALFSLSTQLRAARTADEILPLVLHEICRLFKTEASAILLLAEEGTYLAYALGSGPLTPNQRRRVSLDKSISGHVVRTGQPFVTEDLVNDPQRVPGMLGVEELGPAVFVPLQSEAEAVGTLLVAREKVPLVQAFTPAEVQLLSAIGEMVGNALRRTRLFDDAFRRLERMQALHNIDLAITSSFDAHQILNILLIETISQLKVDAADVLLIDPNSHKLEYRAGRGFHTGIIERTSFAIGEGYAGRTVLERHNLTIEDVSQDHDFMRKTLIIKEGFKSYICAPLITKGVVIGVLEIFQRSLFNPTQEWMDYLTALATQAAIGMDNANLFDNLQHSNFELIHAYEATIEGWSRVLDLREHETERHTARVMEMTLKLANTMGISDEELVHIRRGALLHDIGKMAVPDSILLKDSNLTEDEWKIMRMHPQYAYEMIKPIRYLAPALDIPYCHHEHWDGTGYPRGLKGEEIPLAARIFTICDVWDAVTNDRPYRKGWPKKEALKYIRAQAGLYFDPEVVSGFQNLIKQEK